MKSLPAAIGIAALMAIATPAMAGATDEQGPGIEGIAGIIIEMAPSLSNIAHLFVPANDTLDPGPNNTWVGFTHQADASSGESDVPNAFGPAFLTASYAPFGAGLQILYNLTPADCLTKSIGAGNAIRGTLVPQFQSNPPPGGIYFGPNVGGICSPTSASIFRFSGWLAGHIYLTTPPIFSDLHCAFLVAMVYPGPGSCGQYYSPGNRARAEDALLEAGTN